MVISSGSLQLSVSSVKLDGEFAGGPPITEPTCICSSSKVMMGKARRVTFFGLVKSDSSRSTLSGER